MNGNALAAGTRAIHRSQASIYSNSSTVLTQNTRSETYSSLLSQIRSTTPASSTTNTLNPQLQRLMINTYGIHSPIRKTLSASIRSGNQRLTILSYTILFVLLWKWLIGLGPYSGYQSPPLFGDLEAQRHWVALTLHIKLNQWYYYDLEYWGLDYPPLTAYHSLLLGYLARFINPNFVLLRPPPNGWQDELHSQLKIFLRSSVLASELLVWIPIVFIYHFKTFSLNSSSSSSNLIQSQRQQNNYQRLKNLTSESNQHRRRHQFLTDRVWLSAMYSILVVLLNPNIILIDNGHFQFNSIMLGLSLASVTCFYCGRDLLGVVMFVCSLAFKQMALYYSPAIFAYLFGKCLYLGHPNGTKLFIKLALVSTGTMALIFGPFMFNSDFPQLILQVIHRIFPIGRGLFEDKVGNFWCTLNLIVKIRTLGTVKSLANIALLCTVGAVVPGILIVIISSWKLNPNRCSSFKSSTSITDHPYSSNKSSIPKTIDILPLTLFNSSIGFYLFSFQVHEKSILLPVLPLLLILSRHHKNRKRDSPIILQIDWDIICLISNVSIFSMWPLLKRDQLGVQYLVSILSYNHLIGYNPLNLIGRSSKNLFSLTNLATYLGMIMIHISELFIKPPNHLPDLFVVMNLALSFVIFSASYVWSLVRIYEEAWILNGFRISENHDRPSSVSKEAANDQEIDLDDDDNKSVIDHGGSERHVLAEKQEEEEEEEEFQVRMPTKRSTSLQQHSSRKMKTGSQSETESEIEEIKSMSVGASSGLRMVNMKKRMLKDSRPGSRLSSKAMISSPSGEKLMNRIKNRLQLEASRSQSRSRSRSSQRDTSSEQERIVLPDPMDEEEQDNVPHVPNNNHTQETHHLNHRTSPSNNNFSHHHHHKQESAWETALRQSREEAIRRRREELLVTRGNLK